MRVVVLVLVSVVLLSLPSVVGAQNCVRSPDGLVSWWPGDMHAEDIADDNHGFLQGAASHETGKVGMAFRIPGVVRDHISVPDSSNLNITGELTIEAWISLKEVSQLGGVGQDRSIVRKGPTGDRTYCFAVEGEEGASAGSAKLRYIYSNSAYRDSDLLSWVEDYWYHVAVVRSGNQIAFYRDGASVGTQTLSVTYNPSPGDSVFIGGTSCCGLRGRIDEVRLYNRALTGPEIQSIFQAGGAGVCKPAGHGDMINIDARVYGDFQGVPTLNLLIESGKWALVRRNPDLHPEALYYAWTANTGSAVWRTTFGYKLQDGIPRGSGFCCIGPPGTAEDAYNATPAHQNQFFFSLPEEQVVRFYIGDQILGDNGGGVSLYLEKLPDVPAISIRGLVVLAVLIMAVVLWIARWQRAVSSVV